MNRAAIVEAQARYEANAYARADLVLARGEGSRVYDLDGTAYLDLYGGHAVCLLGHSPARIADAIANQARDLLFYSNLVHLPVRARAAERLCRIAPWPDARAFFVNSGAEANEAALRMARQATGRTRVAAFRGGFHGRTLGALGATALGHYRDAAAPILDPSGAFVFGECNDLDGLDRLVDSTCAAVLVEPIQSMGGVRVLDPAFAVALRRRCDATGALLVFDEIQTAPARTGFWFAGERWGIAPDLITMAKAVAGGFPASVLLARGEVAATTKPGDLGTTFGGGPLACAAIDATLAMLEELDGPSRALALEEAFRRGLAGLGGLEGVRGHGALLGLRMHEDAGRARATLRTERRILVGECPGDPRVMRLFPPLTMTPGELDEALDALRSVLQ